MCIALPFRAAPFHANAHGARPRYATSCNAMPRCHTCDIIACTLLDAFMHIFDITRVSDESLLTRFKAHTSFEAS